MVLIYFVASWAEAICGPYREVVGQAAESLGFAVREVDIDEDMDLAREYRLLNIPAVVVEGNHRAILGARSLAELVDELRSL